MRQGEEYLRKLHISPNASRSYANTFWRELCVQGDLRWMRFCANARVFLCTEICGEAGYGICGINASVGSEKCGSEKCVKASIFVMAQ